MCLISRKIQIPILKLANEYRMNGGARATSMEDVSRSNPVDGMDIFRSLLALKSRDDDLKSVLRADTGALSAQRRFIETNGAFRVVYARSFRSYAFLRQPMIKRAGT